MSAAQKTIAKRDALLYMLHVALIEVRASTSLNAAQKIADVFHNLPLDLVHCKNDEDYENALSKLEERAKRFDLDEYVQALWERALKTMLPV